MKKNDKKILLIVPIVIFVILLFGFAFFYNNKKLIKNENNIDFKEVLAAQSSSKNKVIISASSDGVKGFGMKDAIFEAHTTNKSNVVTSSAFKAGVFSVPSVNINKKEARYGRIKKSKRAKVYRI